MYYSKKDREYYNEYRKQACEKLGITKNDFNWFRRFGNELHTIYERNCNGELSELGYESAVDYVTDKIKVRASKYGLFTYFQSDPRGASVYLDKTEIPYDSYTNAICIY